MSKEKPIDPGHKPVRRVLRTIGPLIMLVGGLLLIIGLVDFFSGMGKFGHFPTKFWCVMVGLPMLAIGGMITSAGFAGRVARYYSQEMTPVGTDTFNYAVRHTKDGIRDVASAIGEGLRGEPGPTEMQVRCHKCNQENDADAKFCSACGAALSKSLPCPDCSELNDPDARFCDNCGRTLHEPGQA